MESIKTQSHGSTWQSNLIEMAQDEDRAITDIALKALPVKDHSNNEYVNYAYLQVLLEFGELPEVSSGEYPSIEALIESEFQNDSEHAMEIVTFNRLVRLAEKIITNGAVA